MAIDGPARAADLITLFLCGDVMTGRGIDQILPHPGDPVLYEPYMTSALGYVELAEQANGSIPRPVDYSYIWGDALQELSHAAADVRIINLETSITVSADYWRGKGINYRMHPQNILCLTAAGIDCCCLANNHVLDWDYGGLVETLDTLQQSRVKTAGAGRNREDARHPAIIEVPGKGRVLIFACGVSSSGIPPSWAAAPDRPGVNLVGDLSDETVEDFKALVRAVKQGGDLVVVSIHWGGNWGYKISLEQQAFAHKLIEEAGIDVIHGHSSHHVKGIELYKEKLIIYGCGDFLNDYEGIAGHEQFRDDLALMYFPRLEASSGKLVALHMTPMQIKRFRLQRASRTDVLWLKDVLNREGIPFGTRVELSADNTLRLVTQSATTPKQD